MSLLGGTIARLLALRQALGRPTEFYALHVEQWREHAARIVVAILQNSRPADANAEDWRRRIDTEAARLSALLFFDFDEIGVILTLGIRPPVPESDPMHYTLDQVSIQDIERWVEAGRGKTDPDAPGKNLDERDAGKSDLQIAWRILYSLKLRTGHWDRLLWHIQTFIGSDDVGAATGIYTEILQAWMEQLGPQIRRDYRAWLSGKMRAIFK